MPAPAGRKKMEFLFYTPQPGFHLFVQIAFQADPPYLYNIQNKELPAGKRLLYSPSEARNHYPVLGFDSEERQSGSNHDYSSIYDAWRSWHIEGRL